MMASPAGDFQIVTGDGVTLAGEQAGEGPAIVLLHGLTATRRYVVMGSRLLERSANRVIAYDARGHGRSSPAPAPEAYGYRWLVEDLRTLMEELQIKRAVLAGASMGAHTAVRFALEHPDRVVALCLITPAFDPDAPRDERSFEHWDALASGLRDDGVEGFVRAYYFEEVPPAWRETVERVVRQRLAAHAHPLAVADALEVVPRSRPFDSWAELEQITAPTIVVASRDEADPGHPLAVAERYSHAIAGARLIVEEGAVDGAPEKSPIAWQGGQLSRVIGEVAAAGRD